MVSMAGFIKKNLETIQEKLSVAALAAGQDTRPDLIAVRQTKIVSGGRTIYLAAPISWRSRWRFGLKRILSALQA